MVERSHVFNLHRALKDRSASQKLATSAQPWRYSGIIPLPNFVVSRRICFKHMTKRKISPH